MRSCLFFFFATTVQITHFYFLVLIINIVVVQRKIKLTSVHHFNTGHCILSYVVLTVVYSVETLTGIKFVGDFCKKISKQVDFCFSLSTFWSIWFLHIFSRKCTTATNFFCNFVNVMVYQVIPRLKAHFARNTMPYLFPEYFQSLRAKK
jgi:hypothetical protein